VYSAVGLSGDSAACDPSQPGLRTAQRCLVREPGSIPGGATTPWSFATQDLCLAFQNPDFHVPQPDVQLGDPCTGDELCHGRIWGVATDEGVPALSAWMWCRDGRVQILDDGTL
jgi:hypothetical protein